MSSGNPMAKVIDGLIRLLASSLSATTLLWRAPFRLWRLLLLRSRTLGQIPLSTQFDGTVIGLGTGRLEMGEYCRLGRNVEFDTTLAGRIVLGNFVRINSGTVIVSNSEVSIGGDTLIGEYVSIRDANHGTEAGTPMRTQPQAVARVQIGRDVWIGRGCCILKGVTIGDGAVIGANSVVTADVPPGMVYAGVPARRIGERGASK